MKSFTLVIFLVFAASAVMSSPIVKEVNEKASNTEIGVSEADVRQKQLLGCLMDICNWDLCPENCV
ncbi:uncharacterized protein BYT42DRAFT_643557 [Radiomyces spectabilis]|uniref:uncharacterized protein n=1 Tax=Radiomyces spectabilis TaxID=64574 RepID=UPI00221E4E00|nr:uncharacterized protein BYT42DRAFT_643557 [Radiomyces spectabilis]KAI8384800.1 hypothetical protein BYT42DRAFT_643557 [Radiomyces spectabilis]